MIPAIDFATALEIVKYNENQARDASGRFAGGGAAPATGPTDDSPARQAALVATHVPRLEAALGTEHFPAVHAALAADKSVGPKAMNAISRSFYGIGRPSGSRKQALAYIMQRHSKLWSFMNENTSASRSAG